MLSIRRGPGPSWLGPAIGLREGLSEVIDWVDAHWDEIKDQPLTYQHKA